MSLIPVVRVKAGVAFTRIAPAGFRLLGAIERAARLVGVDLTITSACDGVHSGPGDPHPSGDAYDVRSQTLTTDQTIGILHAVMVDLCDPGELPATAPTGVTTHRFFGFLEAAGTPNEHLHLQRRKGSTYP